jgi:hypothetical protein
VNAYALPALFAPASAVESFSGTIILAATSVGAPRLETRVDWTELRAAECVAFGLNCTQTRYDGSPSVELPDRRFSGARVQPLELTLEATRRRTWVLGTSLSATSARTVLTSSADTKADFQLRIAAIFISGSWLLTSLFDFMSLSNWSPISTIKIKPRPWRIHE